MSPSRVRVAGFAGITSPKLVIIVAHLVGILASVYGVYDLEPGGSRKSACRKKDSGFEVLPIL